MIFSALPLVIFGLAVGQDRHAEDPKTDVATQPPAAQRGDRSLVLEAADGTRIREDDIVAIAANAVADEYRRVALASWLDDYSVWITTSFGDDQSAVEVMFTRYLGDWAYVVHIDSNFDVVRVDRLATRCGGG